MNQQQLVLCIPPGTAGGALEELLLVTTQPCDEQVQRAHGPSGACIFKACSAHVDTASLSRSARLDEELGEVVVCSAQARDLNAPAVLDDEAEPALDHTLHLHNGALHAPTL